MHFLAPNTLCINCLCNDIIIKKKFQLKQFENCSKSLKMEFSSCLLFI